MKKIHFVLVMLMVSMCSLQGAYAIDIKEPVLNVEEHYDTLVVGKKYFLCNVKTGRFVSFKYVSNGVYDLVAGSHVDSVLSTYNAAAFTFSSQTGGYVQNGQNGQDYMYKYSKNTRLTTSSKSNWFAKCTDQERKHYTISYYTDSCYIGFNAGDSLVHTFKKTDDNITWRLLSADAVWRYRALKNFYNKLVATTEYHQQFIQEYIDQYNALCADPNSTETDINVVSSALTQALNKLNVVSSDTDVPVWVDGDGSYSPATTSTSHWYNGSVYSSSSSNVNINAHFTTDETSCVYLSLQVSDRKNLNKINIYDNDVLIYTIYGDIMLSSSSSYYRRVFLSVEKGDHNMRVEYLPQSDTKCGCSLFSVSVKQMPQISVSLLEPGSLGTEVLYHVDHLKDVTNLKVKGKMNSDDWLKIDMMTGLMILDLSEADVEAIPASQFENSAYAKIILPNNLKRIREKAFYESTIIELVIPESVEAIYDNAFAYSIVRTVCMPKLKEVSSYAFDCCYNLESATFGDSLKVVEDHAFYNCYNLKETHLGESIETIGEAAYNVCKSLERINGGIHLPKSLRVIDDYGFAVCSKLNLRLNKGLVSIGRYGINATAIDSLFVPESLADGFGEVSSSDSYCSSCRKYHGVVYCCANNMSNLVYIEMPTSYNYFPSTTTSTCSTRGLHFGNCPNVTTLVLKSPTLVGVGNNVDLSSSRVTLRVPEYLVNAYKLDEVWYNYKIEGFKTEMVKEWEINSNLTLYARDRFKGNPNIKINAGLNILGDEGMDIDTLTLRGGTRFICHNDDVKINGELYLDYYTTKNQWNFISLPFNIKVSEIVPTNGAKYAIRYYDGANRALNGTGGNWKNFARTDTIMAGTGFIYQTSLDGYTRFVPMDEEGKQSVASNKMFVKSLEANPSTYSSHKGWNFIGNPWQAYFNNHSLNFTAPITVWNGSTYVAYSLIDDDYAIRPNQSFFVQCPEEINSISFPITGRQMTSVITNQSGTKQRVPAVGMDNRQLIDLTIGMGEQEDRTRVVLNDGASVGYEMEFDASKFFSMDGTVPQVYTLDADETPYAINERPVHDGWVKVGFVAPETGCYTISLVRNEAETVYLIDSQTGITTDLAEGDYNFTSEAGTWTNRFKLQMVASQVTSIDEAKTKEELKVVATDGGISVVGAEGIVVVYSIDGKKVAEQNVNGQAEIVVAKGTYLVRTSNGTAKVVVR